MKKNKSAPTYKPKRMSYQTSALGGVILLLGAFALAFSLRGTSDRDANLVTERITGSFNGLYFTTTGDVTITQGDEYEVIIEAADEVLDNMWISFVDGGLAFERANTMWGAAGIQFYITAPDLEAIHLTGSGNIEIADFQTESLDLRLNGSGTLDIDSLIVDDLTMSLQGSGTITIDDLTADTAETTLSGSGTIELESGTIRQQTIRIQGSGDYEASDMVGTDAEAVIAGSGNIYLNAQDHLDASILGSGDIYYTGNPTINSEIVGSGMLEDKN